MKKFILGLSLVCLVFAVPLASADVKSDTTLATWGFNFNGTVQTGNNPDVPGAPPAGWGANYSGFDFNAGFGTINFTFSGGPGTYFIVGFLDHDIGPFPLDSNTGFPNGTPGTGESWQIGPPGYPGDGGDTYFMFAANTLKNLSEIDPGEYADVSAALGTYFTVAAGQSAHINLSVSDTAPTSGFYLSEFDAVTGDQLYISGNLNVTSSAIPNPERCCFWAPG